MQSSSPEIPLLLISRQRENLLGHKSGKFKAAFIQEGGGGGKKRDECRQF